MNCLVKVKNLKKNYSSKEAVKGISFNIKENDIIVISATGYLDYLYKLSKVSFIGGSLFSRYGGHNIIEAAFNESPFIVGPYMKNFEDVLNLFLSRDACLQIEKPDELTDCHKDFIKAVKETSGENWKIGSIERQEFYKEAKKSQLIVSTSEMRPYGCFILTKGVIKPDGSVWVLDK